MVELVDTTDSKSVAERRGGSSPPTGTNMKKALIADQGFFLSARYAFANTSYLFVSDPSLRIFHVNIDIILAYVKIAAARRQK